MEVPSMIRSAIPMHRLRVDGAELAYQVRGDGEPVVLVHGGIVADAFAPLLDEPALRDRHRLIAYHRRGYGESSRVDAPVPVETQAADCLAVMRRVGIEATHVVGYSFGGTIALQLALDWPEAVRSLALLEPVVPAAMRDPATVQYFMDAVGAAFARYGAGDRAAAIDTFARGAFGPEYRARLERALPGALDRAAADADALFRGEFPVLQGWAFGPEQAARLRQPTLSVYHDDPAWSGFAETHEALRAWLPQLEALVVPGDSHLLQMTEPRAVARGLAEFFARH
jgi:pimeloyl-ACP methyl ester carboxylesterase